MLCSGRGWGEKGNSSKTAEVNFSNSFSFVLSLRQCLESFLEMGLQ